MTLPKQYEQIKNVVCGLRPRYQSSMDNAEAYLAPLQHALLETAPKGFWGGPTYSYRGAEIRCLPGGHVCGLVMEAHPLTGWTFGVPGTITHLVGSWLDRGRLPDYMRAVPKG